MGAAWEWHAMCESAFMQSDVRETKNRCKYNLYRKYNLCFESCGIFLTNYTFRVKLVYCSSILGP